MKHIKKINEYFSPNIDLICKVSTDKNNFNVILNDLLQAHNDGLITTKYSVDKVKNDDNNVDTFEISLSPSKSEQEVLKYLNDKSKKGFKYKLL